MAAFERIVLEVDEKGAATALSSANREVARLESSFVRAGQTAEQRLLAKIATLKNQMANDPMRLKELDALQQRVLGNMAKNAEGFGQKIKGYISDPLGSAGNAAQTFVTKFGSIGVVGTAAAVALAGAAKAAVDLVRHYGEAAEATENLAIRTGLTVRETLRYQAAGKLAQMDIGALQASMRYLSQAMSENSDEGEKQKKALENLGVKAFDANRELKPTGQLIREIGERITALPDIGAKTRALVGVFGRGGGELLPLFEKLPGILALMDEMGISFDENLNKRLAEGNERMEALLLKWDLFKKSVAGAALEFMSNTGLLDTPAEKQKRRQEMANLARGTIEESTLRELANRTQNPAAGILAGQFAARDPEKLRAERKHAAEEWDRYATSWGTTEEQIKRQITKATTEQKEAEADRDVARHKAATETIAALNAELELLKSTSDLSKFATEALKDLADQMDETRKKTEKAFEILNENRADMKAGNLGPMKEVAAITEKAYGWQAHELDRALDAQNKLLDAQNDADEKRIKASDQYWETFARQAERRFDEIKDAWGGLFDAAFMRARGFWDAMKNLAYAYFLTPVKQGFGTMMAGGGTGGFGGLGGLFGMSSGLSMAQTVTGGPGGTSGFAGPVGGAGVAGGAWNMAGMATGLKAFGMANAGSLALGGATLGGFGAFRMGQSHNRVLKGLAPGVGAVSGLLGFGALSYLFPSLIAAGPVGWIAAAGIGAFAGLAGMLFKSATDKAREKIKALYGVDIQSKNVLEKIVYLAKQGYGGNLDMAIRTQEVRDLIELYAMSTGQNSQGIAGRMQPISMVQMSGGLYRQTSPAAALAPVSAVGSPTVVIPLSIDGRAVGAAVLQNGRVVADGALKASQSNYRRVDTALSNLSPATIRG